MDSSTGFSSQPDDSDNSEQPRSRRRKLLALSNKCYGQAITINHLPVTILLEIFQYFTQSELIHKLSLVCKLWCDITHKPSLYKHLQITGSKSTSLSDELPRSFVQRTAVTVSLKIDSNRFSRVLNLLSCGEQLKRLLIYCHKHIKTSEVLAIVNNCPNIKVLMISGITIETCRPICKLRNLVSLDLSKVKIIPASLNKGKWLSLIAKNCPKLEKVSISFKTDIEGELCEFLLQVKDRLTCLVLEDVFCPDTLFRAVSMCYKLQILSLRKIGELSDSDLHFIGTLKQLVCFRLEYYYDFHSNIGLPGLFVYGNLGNLQEVHLREVKTVNDTVLYSICDGCPKLKKFSIFTNDKISEDALIHMLKVCRQLTCIKLFFVACVSPRFLNEIPNFVPFIKTLSIIYCHRVQETDLMNIRKVLPNTLVSSKGEFNDFYVDMYTL